MYALQKLWRNYILNKSVYFQLADADEVIYALLSNKYTPEELKAMTDKYHVKWNDVP